MISFLFGGMPAHVTAMQGATPPTKTSFHKNCRPFGRLVWLEFYNDMISYVRLKNTELSTEIY